MPTVQEKPEFSVEDIQALAKWQNSDISCKYNKGIRSLGEAFSPFKDMQVPSILYRFVNLSDNYLDKLKSGTFQGGIESWTKDIKVAQRYMAECTADGNKVILKLVSSKANILLDIDAIHKNRGFKRSVQIHRCNGEVFDEGLDLSYSEREVVLQPKTPLGPLNIFIRG